MSNLTLLARVFYLIRSNDVELAEDFLRRAPDVSTITELNSFFHLLLTQYPHDTQPLRAALVDCEAFEPWAQAFTGNILPSLRAWRFPDCTHKSLPPVYATAS